MPENYGYHLIADLKTSDVSENFLLTNLEDMQKILVTAAEAAGANCLKVEGHSFGSGQGITAFVMLAESHISVHSWPENGFAAFDIFMCGESAEKIEKAVYILKKNFPKAEIHQRLLKRNYSGI